MGKAWQNGHNSELIGRSAAQQAAAAGAERPGGRGSARPASPVCYILYEIYNKKDHLYIYYYISPLLIVIYYIYSPSPLFLLPFQLQVSGTPLLWLQSDLWYSPIAIFKIALKIKKTPAVLSARALSWKNLQLGLLAIPLYHISALIARKIPPAEARGIFPEK